MPLEEVRSSVSRLGSALNEHGFCGRQVSIPSCFCTDLNTNSLAPEVTKSQKQKNPKKKRRGQHPTGHCYSTRRASLLCRAIRSTGVSTGGSSVTQMSESSAIPHHTAHPITRSSVPNDHALSIDHCLYTREQSYPSVQSRWRSHTKIQTLLLVRHKRSGWRRHMKEQRYLSVNGVGAL